MVERADDVEALLREAGELLGPYMLGAEVDGPAVIEDEAAEIRALYELVERTDPGNVTAAVGRTVLALGMFQAHVENDLDELFVNVTGERSPFPGLEEDDETGRDLADTTVRAARRALELDPANNLAAFALGLALEWLGDPEAAAAYREALRLDPGDHAALVRAETLQDADLPWPPPAENPSHHAGAFYVLRMTELISNSGTELGWTWLVTAPSDVRRAAEGYLGKRVPGVDGRDTFQVEAHMPGRPVEITELSGALRRTDGRAEIGWSAVAMPELSGELLPDGQPIREGGEMLFFGANEHFS